jgi:hypothetical protein
MAPLHSTFITQRNVLVKILQILITFIHKIDEDRFTVRVKLVLRQTT